MSYREKGNVLFLILIAVALFAALSYAVTQSSRSGGKSSNKENLAIDVASLTQYTTLLRQNIMRFNFAGVAYDDMVFYGDDGTDTCAGVPTLCVTGEKCVFAVEGAGVGLPPINEKIYVSPVAGSALPTKPGEINTNLWVDCRTDVSDWGMGGTGFERAIYFLNVNENVCFEYNRVNIGVGGVYDMSTAAELEPTACITQSGRYDIYFVMYVQ